MGVTIWSNDKIKNMSQCGKREEKIVEGEEYEEAKGAEGIREKLNHHKLCQG